MLFYTATCRQSRLLQLILSATFNITQLQYAIGQKSKTVGWAAGAAAWPKCGSAISLRLVSLHMLPITQLYMLTEISVLHCGPAATPAT